MVSTEGIEVSVIRREHEVRPDSVYQEHTSHEEGRERTYIKIATREFFQVRVEVTPEFDFMGLPLIQIYCSIDDEEFNWTLLMHEVTALPAHHPDCCIEFKDTERYVDGSWMSFYLAFGDLRIDASIAQTPRQFRAAKSKLGRIFVRVRRGTGQNVPHELTWPNELAADITASSRTVVEDYRITHSLRAVPDAYCPQPITWWKFIEADGELGDPIRITVRFRSQEALEQLGIIATNNQPDQVNEADAEIGSQNGKSAIKREQVPSQDAGAMPVAPTAKHEKYTAAGVGSTTSVKQEPKAMSPALLPVQSNREGKRPMWTNIKQEPRSLSPELRLGRSDPTGNATDPSTRQEPDAELPTQMLRHESSTQHVQTPELVQQKPAALPTKLTSQPAGEDDDVQIIEVRPVARLRDQASTLARAAARDGKRALIKSLLDQIKLEEAKLKREEEEELDKGAFEIVE